MNKKVPLWKDIVVIIILIGYSLIIFGCTFITLKLGLIYGLSIGVVGSFLFGWVFHYYLIKRKDIVDKNGGVSYIK